jgi:hypothetical protein
MKWHSTEDSLNRCTPSILSIIESLAAMVISMLIAYHFSTVKYIAIGAFIAPLLLLQTDLSSKLALKLSDDIYNNFYKLFDYSDKYYQQSKFPTSLIANVFLLIAAIILYLGTLISIFLIKILATFITCITHPIYTLKRFPRNWRKIVLATDFFSIPEIIPGIESLDNNGNKLELFRYKNLIHQYTEIHFVVGELGEPRINRKYRSLPIIILIVAMLLFPCYIYRWSLKSTALIWSPLLWILREPSTGDITFKLAQITEAAIYRVIRYYSLFIILMFFIKMYIWLAWQNIAETWQKFPAINIINNYLVPKEIPLWHLFAVANALGAWLIFIMADWFLQKYRHGQPVPENYIEKVLHIHKTISRLLTFYIIVCNFYITVNLGWPHLEVKLFPWQ